MHRASPAPPAPQVKLAGKKLLESPVIPFAVLVLTVSATLWVWHESKTATETIARANFHEQIELVQHRIADRISDCESVLLGGTGLFAVQDEVKRQDWRDYIAQLHPEQTLAGVQGVGFTARILAADLPAHLARLRAEGFPEYAVRPDFPRDEYHSIIFLEPFRDRNLRAFGYDMMTETVRQKAMEQARDTGRPAMSGPVTLVQEIPGQPLQQGFLIYAPVYARGAPVDTVTARRTALRGFVYSPFRAGDFIDRLFFLEPTGITLEIYGGSVADDSRRLYDSRTRPRAEPTPPGFSPRYTASIQLRLLGQPWTLVARSLPKFEATQNQANSPLILGLGLSWSLLVSGFVFLLSVRNRAHSQLASMSAALQQAHHDLEKRVLDRTAELAELSARFQMLLTVASDGIHVLDEQGRLHDCSDSFCRMLGYTADETVGLHVHDWDAAIPAEELPAQIRQLIQQPKVFETLHRRKDGTVFPVEINARGIDLDGRKFLYASSRDISVRRQLEAARQEALDHLEKIARRVPGVVYQYRLRPDGTSCFPFASDPIREIYGVTPAEVREDATKVFGALYPDDRAGVVASIQESARRLTPWSHEYRAKNGDGPVRWLLGNSVPEREPDGSILWHGFITDITERKRTTEALAKSEKLYRSLCATMVSGFAYCEMHYDAAGRPIDFTYLSVNAAFEKQTGLRDVVGKRVTEVIPGIAESDRHLMEVCGRVASTGKAESLELFLSGLQAWFWLTICSPEPGYFMVVFDCITERIAAQRQLQELLAQTERDARLKAELLREVNHRVTNNLTSVLGLLALENEHRSGTEAPVVADVTQRLSQRIRSLLDVHRMLTNSGWRPIQLDRLADQVIRAALGAAPWRNDALLAIAPSPVVISPRQAGSIALIFNELTTNTVKNIRQPTRPVEIRFHAESDAETVTFRYRDNGPGYPADVLTHQRSNIGLKLIREIVATTLRGTVEFTNDHGAVAVIRMRAEEATRT